jgi:hypothetical protein
MAAAGTLRIFSVTAPPLRPEYITRDDYQYMGRSDLVLQSSTATRPRP